MQEKRPLRTNRKKSTRLNLKGILNRIVDIIYLIGNATINLLMLPFESGASRGFFSHVFLGIKKAFSAIGKALGFAGKSIWKFFKKCAGGIKVFFGDKEKRLQWLFALRVKLICLLSGYKRENLSFPLTEKVKTSLVRRAVGRSINFIAPLIAIIGLVTIISASRNYKMGVKVELEGQEVGVLASESDFERLKTDVSEFISKITGTEYSVEAVPTFSSAVYSTNSGDASRIRDALLGSATDVIVNSSGISVDGEIIAVNDDIEGLNDILNKKLEAEMPQDGENSRTEFIEKVSVVSGFMPKNKEAGLPEIKELANSVKNQDMFYTVKDDDTMGKIAVAVGMKYKDLMALNPDVVPTKLRPGQQVKIRASMPLISVKVITTITYEEEIAYKTVKVETDSLYKNQTKTITPGAKGVAEVTAEVTFINGVETSRTELSKTVKKEPVSLEMYVGTKALPTTAATGSFRRPVASGYIISSDYGARRGTHTGVDFACNRGTPIMAADGGTVVQASWNGGYGLSIVIDHGNGIKTRYAHCSAIYVSSGQKVAKGQTIAAVGSTGNSTGPHLHFEVIVNGSFRNPWNYI